MKKSDRSQPFPCKSVVNKHIALVYVAIVPVGRGLVDYKPYFCMDFGLTLSGLKTYSEAGPICDHLPSEHNA